MVIQSVPPTGAPSKRSRPLMDPLTPRRMSCRARSLRRLPLRTGRIGSRQQLAENAWLVSLGCSGGAQRSCGVHLHIIQHWFYGKPILRKIGRFPLCACGNGVDLPHLAKRAFRDQIGPNVQKAMLLGSPSHQGLKNCGFSQKYFFFLTIFLIFGDFFAVFALLAIF